MFFDNTPVYTPRQFPTVPYEEGKDLDAGMNPLWDDSWHPILFWKTEDRKGMVPKFETVKGEVEKAWYLERARELARQKAEELEKKTSFTRGDLAQLKDLAAEQKLPQPIDLPAVARRVAAPDPTARFPIAYNEGTIPADKIPNAPPIKELLDQLLALKKPGDTILFNDVPRKTYYLAVLVKRVEPRMEDFYEAYAKGNPLADRNDPLLNEFESERLRDYVGGQNYVGALLKELQGGRRRG